MKKGLTLLLSLVLVLAMSVTAFAAEDWVTPVQNIEKWDEEVDFLVVGYGLAGAAAAVEAYDIDPTAKILVLEKMPETLAGGNSIASGQTFLVPAESAVETVKTYLYNCNKPNPIPDEYLTWLCEGFATQLPWIEYVADGVDYEAGYVGGGELKWGSMVVEFSNFEGSTFDGCSAHLRAKGSTFENGGVWRCFAEAAKVRGIELSLLQRCAAHCASKTDIEESFAAGKAAVEYAVAGTTDKMVGFERTSENGAYKCNIKLFDLTVVANTEKKVPAEWLNATKDGLNEKFVEYALPLIQGETDLCKEDGLPRFVKLKKVKA